VIFAFTAGDLRRERKIINLVFIQLSNNVGR
jgi:hypothetical protein